MSNLRTQVNFEKHDQSTGDFVVSPLANGMGNTIGNSLRRVLLSSLKGASIVAVTIDGIDHEFAPLPNAVEDVLDVICNLKSLVFKLNSEESAVATLSFSGKGVVTAKEINLPEGLTLINPDQHIAEFTKPGKLNIKITIQNGVGYVASENHDKVSEEVNTIYVDSSFSPIIRVNPVVEKTRVGKSLDYDALKLEVLTDGSIDVEDAVKEASTRLVELFMLFADMKQPPVIEYDEPEVQSETAQDYGLTLTIDDLELSARSMNCLKKAGIHSVSELVSKDMSELIQIKNFGKKSADEINDKLSQYNLSLKHMEVVD